MQIKAPSTMMARGLILLVCLALAWSAIGARDALTWLLEVIWVILALPLVIWRWRAFPLSTLLCWALALHALVLMYGGHYTYAETPLGNWAREVFDLQRNHYDRLGHFMQGFVPAILVRELLLRTSPLQPGLWLGVLTTCGCLAFSAFFEMIEWWAALLWGGEADAFLATQGDVWDTQWDMFLCLCGAILSQLCLAPLHNHQLGIKAHLD
jgi:putative membrane protein